jgi:Flp pilus assembly protein TadD
LAVLAVALAVSILASCRPGLDLSGIPRVELADTDPAVRRQLEAARGAVESRPTDVEANGRLGMLYELYQYPEAARVCYGRASTLAPREFRWLYYLGRLERFQGDSAQAATTLAAALAIDPSYGPAMAELAEAHLEQGRSEEAESTFRRLLESRPRSVAGLTGLGRVLAGRGEHAGAIERYETALEIAPRHAPLHYALALSYRALGRDDDAGRHLEIASSGGPASPDPDPLVAAIAELEVGSDRDYREGKSRFLAGRFTEATSLFEQVVEAEPDHAGAHGALGAALMRTNRNTEALAAYTKAVDLNPGNIDFLRPYALLLLRSRRLDEAETRMREVLELGGDHYDDHHILGAALVGLERLDEAMIEFESALERKPDHTEARAALIQILWRKTIAAGSDAEALPSLRRIVEIEPRHVQALTLLGGILESEGALAEALDAYERALAVNPNLPEVVARRNGLKARM